MKRQYGTMVGCQTAVAWVSNLKDVDTQIRDRVLARMQYEFDKDEPLAPVLHKGVYGRKYDYYACGNCARTISPEYRFCPGCGYMIGWKKQ